MSETKKQPTKAKYWLALSYDDSAPADILERAKQCGVECACIYHDKDFNALATPDTYTDEVLEPGQAKKPHRHWIFAFPNTTTEKHASNTILAITNGPKIKGATNIKGAYAYFTHKHDPDKYQYDSKDIMTFNGFAPENYFSLNSGEEDEAFKCIEGIIKDYDLEEYCDLIDRLAAEFPDLARFARTHTLHIKAYLQSKHMKRRQAKRDRLLELQIAEYEDRARVRNEYNNGNIDLETGEVLAD